MDGDTVYDADDNVNDNKKRQQTTQLRITILSPEAENGKEQGNQDFEKSIYLIIAYSIKLSKILVLD